MNGLFLGTIAFLIILAVVGYKKGFVKIAYSLLSTILAIFLVSALVPHIQTFIVEKTPIYDKVVTYCSEQIQSEISISVEETGESVSSILNKSGLKIPEALEKTFTEMKISEKYTQSAADRTGAAIASWMIYILSYVLTYIIVIIGLGFLGKLLNSATKLPIVKGANKTLGLFAGILQGVLYLWMGALVLSVFCATRGGQQIIAMINENVFLKFLYDHNGILYLASLFI